MARKRTTHRSSKGRKLLAVRVVRPKAGQRKGQFKDIQTWEASSRQDQLKRSKSELAKKKRCRGR